MTTTHTTRIGTSAPAAGRTGAETDPAAGPVLLELARAAIIARGGPAERRRADPTWLDDPGATFVTLTLDGHLRGCKGSVEAHRSLREDVRRNACAAAFHDSRFPPLPATDVPEVRIEVSLLSPAEPLPCNSRRELLARLRPGVDGVILAWHGHRATFLPQVWEQLPRPEQFLEHLLLKAGLPGTFWEPGLVVRRYTVVSWTEPVGRAEEVSG
jgi:AmmeMemoRadiSam system protein A